MKLSPTLDRPVASPLPDVVGLGGAVAGFVGGIASMVTGAGLSLAFDGDMWLQAKQIAAIVLGDAVAATPGFAFGPVLVGTILHLIVSVLLGALFGILKRRVLKLPSDLGVPVLVGLIYGMLIWAVAFFIVLPVVHPLLLSTYAPSFILEHLVYGIVTGLVYTVLRPEPYVDLTPRSA